MIGWRKKSDWGTCDLGQSAKVIVIKLCEVIKVLISGGTVLFLTGTDFFYLFIGCIL